MYYPRQVAMAVGLLSFLSIPSHAMFASFNSDFSAISGNRIQEQTYMDNYVDDNGTGPLASLRSSSTYTISDAYNAKTFLDFDIAYYDKINTTVGGLGVISRSMSQAGMQHTFNLALDYTDYDGMEFYQATLGLSLDAHGYTLGINGYIPFGDEQTYSGALGSTLTGTNGADMRISKQFDQLTLSLEGTYFWGRGIKSAMSAGALGCAYDFNKMLTIGGSYGFLNGLDSSDTGYRGYLTIPLFRGHSSHDPLAISNAPVKRQLGATIQAKAITCATGSSDYSKNGSTICADVNPFPGLQLMKSPKAGILTQQLKAGVDLSSADQNFIDLSGQTLTFKKGVFHIISNVTKVKNLVVEPGAILAFTNGGHIIAGHENTKIGAEGAKTTLLNAPVFARLLRQEGPNNASRLTGVMRALNNLDVPNATDGEMPQSATNPGYFLTLTGQSHMDFNADDNTVLDSNNPLLGAALVSNKATGAGLRDSTLVTSTGPLANVNMGGGADMTSTGSGITKYATINNVNFHNGGLMLLGANASMERINFAGGSDAQIYQVGGAVESKTTGHSAGSRNTGFVKLRGGAQYTAVGNYYDQKAAAQDSGFKGIAMYDQHVTVGDNATNQAKLPQISVLQSLFNMGGTSESDDSRKDALYIDPSLNGSANGGLALVLINNVVNMPAVTSTAAISDASNIRFGNLNSTAVTQFGTAGTATAQMDASMLVSGVNLVSSIASTNASASLSAAQLAYGLGLGNASKQAPDTTNYGTGNATFPFALEDTGAKSTGYLPALVTTTLTKPNPVDLDTGAELITNLKDFAYAGSDASSGSLEPLSATMTASVTGMFKQHLKVGVPTADGVTNRHSVAHNAITSRFGTSPQTLLSADSGAQSNAPFRTSTAAPIVADSQKAFITGNNTLTGRQMVEYIYLLSQLSTQGRNDQISKIQNNDE